MLEVPKALEALMENAKRKKLGQKPGLSDAIILATARKVGGKVLTGRQALPRPKGDHLARPRLAPGPAQYSSPTHKR